MVHGGGTLGRVVWARVVQGGVHRAAQYRQAAASSRPRDRGLRLWESLLFARARRQDPGYLTPYTRLMTGN